MQVALSDIQDMAKKELEKANSEKISSILVTPPPSSIAHTRGLASLLGRWLAVVLMNPSPLLAAGRPQHVG